MGLEGQGAEEYSREEVRGREGEKRIEVGEMKDRMQQEGTSNILSLSFVLSTNIY